MQPNYKERIKAKDEFYSLKYKPEGYWLFVLFIFRSIKIINLSTH